MFTALSGISVNDLQPSTASGPHSSTPGAISPKQAPVPVAQTDTVKLSVTQQVRNLHSEGEGPGQIASSLGLDSAQVNNDLYVSLTWPQLLSKVASSSLTLGTPSSDASVTGFPTPVAGSPAPANLAFPATQHVSESSGAAAPATKGPFAPPLVIFPTSKATPLPLAVEDPAAKPVPLPTPSTTTGKDAAAA